VNEADEEKIDNATTAEEDEVKEQIDMNPDDESPSETKTG
jgi:hypothetical protein